MNGTAGATGSAVLPACLMLLATAISSLFGFLVLPTALGQSVDRCWDKCTLQASRVLVANLEELVAQSESYAVQWKSDCDCLERRQSYLNASIAYLDGAVAVLQGEFVEPADKCPSWADINVGFLALERNITALKNIIDKYEDRCCPPLALCKVWNQKFQEILDGMRLGIAQLLGGLTSESCQIAPCDIRLSCKCPQDGQCKLPCNGNQIRQYWLQVARFENLKAQEFFAQAEPSRCDECCLLRQVYATVSLGHYVTSATLIRSIFGSSIKGLKSSNADLETGSCGELASWSSVATFLSSSTSLFPSFEDLLCALALCGANDVGASLGDKLAKYYFSSGSGTLGRYIQGLCNEENN